MSNFSIVVGNVGEVYKGTDLKEAGSEYNDWVEQSKAGIGRAGNESVVLFKDGEPVLEHEGRDDENR